VALASGKHGFAGGDVMPAHATFFFWKMKVRRREARGARWFCMETPMTRPTWKPGGLEASPQLSFNHTPFDDPEVNSPASGTFGL